MAWRNTYAHLTARPMAAFLADCGLETFEDAVARWDTPGAPDTGVGASLPNCWTPG